MHVAVVQTDPLLGDLEHNLESIRAGIAAAGTDLVVFPECALQGYGFASRDDASLVAETFPGPSSRAIGESCARSGAIAIYGFVERAGERLYNAAALIGPGGPLGLYRKVHLPFIGLDRFADAGDRGFPVFRTPIGNLGLLVCYDLSFPEAARALKLGGAQVLIVPTNWPMAAQVSCVHAPPVRAQENHIHVVTADRVGREAGFEFLGGSRIVDCGGQVLATAGAGPEVLRAELDPAAADRNRVIFVAGAYELDRIADRRPEEYGRRSAPDDRGGSLAAPGGAVAADPVQDRPAAPRHPDGTAR